MTPEQQRRVRDLFEAALERESAGGVERWVSLEAAGDPSAAIEQLGVDDAANRPVNQVARDTFEQTQRSRTVKLDLSE